MITQRAGGIGTVILGKFTIETLNRAQFPYQYYTIACPASITIDRSYYSHVYYNVSIYEFIIHS